jgi:hypothetical protein
LCQHANWIAWPCKEFWVAQIKSLISQVLTDGHHQEFRIHDSTSYFIPTFLRMHVKNNLHTDVTCLKNHLHTEKECVCYNFKNSCYTSSLQHQIQTRYLNQTKTIFLIQFSFWSRSSSGQFVEIWKISLEVCLEFSEHWLLDIFSKKEISLTRYCCITYIPLHIYNKCGKINFCFALTWIGNNGQNQIKSHKIWFLVNEGFGWLLPNKGLFIIHNNKLLWNSESVH